MLARREHIDSAQLRKALRNARAGMATSMRAPTGLFPRIVAAPSLGRRETPAFRLPFSPERCAASAECARGCTRARIPFAKSAGMQVARTASVLPGHRTCGAQRARPATAPCRGRSVVRRALAVQESYSAPQDVNPLAAAPPFTLQDIRKAIPEHCWERNALASMGYLARDVAVVFGLAYAAFAINQPWVWPLYWVAQGTMFWALFVVGHDCGHRSFSNNNTLNDLIGHLTHSSILVPYHPWRISHRTHHAYHGHVELDESWVPTPESEYRSLNWFLRFVRFFPVASLFLYPFYLAQAGRGSHYDPNGALFTESERGLVVQSNLWLTGMLGLLAFTASKIGLAMTAGLYFVPYLVFVAWLDFVTYMHHHGPEDGERVPWYRGEEWSYLRGGLSTLDHDYGIFNKIHHDIGTHVVHHLFPQMPHYHLCEATEAVKPVMGPYYREPKKSGPIPFHLWETFSAAQARDHYVPDTGDVVFYQTDANVLKP